MQLVSNTHDVAHIDGQTEINLTVIVPVFNEEQSLDIFHHVLCRVIAKMRDENIQIIYVNDGSTDASWQVIQGLSCTYASIECINLSRNFGKEAAMTAGIDHALGDAVTILDADLQDPPELLIPMLDELRKGFDMVNMRRRNRHKDSKFKQFCAKHYYRLFRWMSDMQIETEIGDFRMMSRRVVKEIQTLQERNRYMKGIMSWPGFKQTTLVFDRPERVAGDSKWSFFQLCGLALSGIIGFSIKPLRLATISGILVSCSAFVYGMWILVKTMLIGDAVAGYPSLMLIQLFLGGVQLLAIGIVGEYMGRIYIESKGRPIYLVMDRQRSSINNTSGNEHYG